MANKLAALKASWKKAKDMPNKFSGDEIDDGRYMASITDADVDESKSSNRLQVMLEFTIQDGEFDKKTKRSYYGLDTEIGIQIVINTLLKLGIEIEDPTNLEDDIKQVIGKLCKIQLKTKGEFQNVYILKVLGDAPVEDKAPSQAVDEPEVEDVPVKSETTKKEKKAKTEPVEEIVEDIVEEEPVEPETVELAVGMEVVFPIGKSEVMGIVKKLEEKEGTLLITHKGKTYRAPADKVSVRG